MTEIETISAIEKGEVFLGIELGSTRIKSILIDGNHEPIATGSYSWENRYENGIWTYDINDVWTGLRASYRKLADNVAHRFGLPLIRIGAAGISAMMHGYLAFDASDELLVSFRTWRNTITLEAAEKLSELFEFHIPQRWSVAHLYQAILNRESHVKDIAFMTTLAGYIHWKLTGCKVLGIGDASGMFPVDSETVTWDSGMMETFGDLIADQGFPWKLPEILPEILTAGENAGRLTEAGAALLDDSGQLEAGVPLCPPEGDAGTGMVATNSVSPRTGNISAGTSIFAMIVLEKALQKAYPEIDMVTTPAGKPVAMVHCNNSTSDIDAWAGVFREFAQAYTGKISDETLYQILYEKASEGEADGGDLLIFNYLSGEELTGFEQGRPLFVRTPNSRLTLANFMRTHLYSVVSTLKIGMEILEEEKVVIDSLVGHGGLFKTGEAGQHIMAAAMNAPVSVFATAGEGGAWGIALLAAYLAKHEPGEDIGEYLMARAFVNTAQKKVNPDPADVNGFSEFLSRYRKGFPIERAAVDCFQE